jgi:hypothetical protein
MQQIQTQPPKVTRVQPKLKVNEPGDMYEQEADAMADRVMRMVGGDRQQSVPKPVTGLIGNSVQRKCAGCEEEDKRRKVMRKETSGWGGFSAPTSFASSLGTSNTGNPLPATTRTQMEQAFDTNFSDVRIHADAQSVQLNNSINAKAFTYGRDIFFNQGELNLNSASGKRLLAHELTHVVQQGGQASGAIQRSPGSPAGGCGLCYGTPANVGREAHIIIQEVMEGVYPVMETEAPLAPSPGDENGFLDLLVVNGLDIQIGEIKPANARGLLDGERDLLWYEAQIRAVMGDHMSVSRMDLPTPVGALPFPTLAPANCPQVQELFVDPPIDGIYTYFCEPDYSVLIRECDCRTGRRPAPRTVTVTSPAPQTEEERSRLRRLADFLQELVESGAALEPAIRRFLNDNRDLIHFVLAAGVAALIAVFGKDIVTAGTTILTDVVLVPIIAMLMRIAWSMQALAR